MILGNHFHVTRTYRTDAANASLARVLNGPTGASAVHFDPQEIECKRWYREETSWKFQTSFEFSPGSTLGEIRQCSKELISRKVGRVVACAVHSFRCVDRKKNDLRASIAKFCRHFEHVGKLFVNLSNGNHVWTLRKTMSRPESREFTSGKQIVKLGILSLSSAEQKWQMPCRAGVFNGRTGREFLTSVFRS